jgi:hypothetical protein
MNKIRLFTVSCLLGLLSFVSVKAQKLDFDYKIDTVSVGTLSQGSVDSVFAFPTTFRFERFGDSSVVKFGNGREVKSFYVTKFVKVTTSPDSTMCSHLFEVKDNEGNVYLFQLAFLNPGHILLAFAFSADDKIIIYFIKQKELTLEG